MKRHVLIGVLTASLVLGVLTRPALAILGVGDIVFDPSVYAQAVQQLVQLEQQYQQLVNTYITIRNQYAQMIWMAQRVPVNMAARYRAALTPWHPTLATNTYGTTGGWVDAINGGAEIAEGYARATEALGAYGAGLDLVPGDHQDHVKTSYATVELADGANLGAMDLISRLRGHAQQTEGTIQALEDDSLSSDPLMNTEVAVLNKINAAHLITVRNTQDTNKLLVALTEEQLIQAKRTRDAEAQAINANIRFRREGKAVLVAQAAGASDAMLAWRMP